MIFPSMQWRIFTRNYQKMLLHICIRFSNQDYAQAETPIQHFLLCNLLFIYLRFLFFSFSFCPVCSFSYCILLSKVVFLYCKLFCLNSILCLRLCVTLYVALILMKWYPPIKFMQFFQRLFLLLCNAGISSYYNHE